MSTVVTHGLNGLFYVTRGFQFGAAAVVTTQPIRNFSLREWRRWHRPEHEQEFRKLGISEEAADVVAEVAARQAEADEQHRLDEQQRLDELMGEMLLKGIQLESAHIKALNDERERLIHAEIAAFRDAIQLDADNNNTLALLLMSTV